VLISNRVLIALVSLVLVMARLDDVNSGEGVGYLFILENEVF